MRFSSHSLFLGAALLIAATSLASAPCVAADTRLQTQRIYRVDTVSAITKGQGRGRTIEVQAKGAVQSGGWQNPRLRLLKNDAHTLTLEFVAEPPPPGMVVIQALVPVKAQAAIHTRRAITTVHVLADSNDVTQPVVTQPGAH